MRLLIIVAIIFVLGWLGFETRNRSKTMSTAFFGIGALFLIIFVVVLIVGAPE